MSKGVTRKIDRNEKEKNHGNPLSFRVSRGMQKGEGEKWERRSNIGRRVAASR